MFTTITICKRPDTTNPFFFHSEIWQDPAWQARIEEVKAEYLNYSEEEIVSEDELTLTKINNFNSQEQAEEIITYNLAHFPAQYTRALYAKEKGHFFIMTPMFDRDLGKFVPE
jgi:enoyl reductase-like protein